MDEDVLHTHPIRANTKEYYSAINKEEKILPFVTWVDLDRGYHDKGNKSKTNTVFYFNVDLKNQTKPNRTDW